MQSGCASLISRYCRISGVSAESGTAPDIGRHGISSPTMLALVLSGILVTTQNGTELAREQWRDDGKVVTSDITVMGQKAKFSIDRGKKKLHIDQNGESVDIPIEPG